MSDPEDPAPPRDPAIAPIVWPPPRPPTRMESALAGLAVVGLRLAWLALGAIIAAPIIALAVCISYIAAAIATAVQGG